MTDRKGFVWVGDIGALDGIVNDCEATHIIADNFFSHFKFDLLGDVIQKIVSKLRINGTITFYQLDIDILSHQYARMNMDIGQYNTTLFSAGPIASTFNMESLCDLLIDAGLTMETKEVDYDTCQSVVTAKRTP